jgi:prolipoprotein diacylglyceryltransferase
MGQILSLPLIIFGVVMFIWKKSYKLKAEAQD